MRFDDNQSPKAADGCITATYSLAEAPETASVSIALDWFSDSDAGEITRAGRIVL
jgi:hypothetical protein